MMRKYYFHSVGLSKNRRTKEHEILAALSSIIRAYYREKRGLIAALKKMT
jgi:hypothetical protein